MNFRIFRDLRNSSAFRVLTLVLTTLSLFVMSFHLTLYRVEEDFLSNFFFRSNHGEQKPNIDRIMMEFQENVSQARSETHSAYRSHSGLPVFSYSEIIDFAIFRTYDCGHAVALFNRAARYCGVDCGPIVTFGSNGGHVISTCEIDGNIVFLDPLFNIIYRHPDGTLATQNEITSNWEGLVRESDSAGIRNFPIESFRVRNPKFFLNRVVDFFVEQGVDAMELFSFRRIIVSTHLFLAMVSGIAGVFFLLLFSRCKS